MKRARSLSVSSTQTTVKVGKTTKAKKRTSNKQKDFIPLGLGFPRKVSTTHKYVTQNLITSTAAAMQTYRFSANGMFDPDITNTGHQPMHFDELGAIYDHYVVLGSKITIQFSNAETPGGELMVCIILNDDTNISPGSVNAALENSDVVGCLVSNNNQRVYSLSKTFSAKKVYGGESVNNPNMIGTVTANPSEQSYFDIHVQSCKAATTTAIRFLATIEYYAEWTEVRDQAGS